MNQKGYDKTFDLTDKETSQGYLVHAVEGREGNYKAFCPVCAKYKLLINEAKNKFICQGCNWQGKVKSEKKGVKMRGKKLLAAFLLGVGLCFVPALGHGEVEQWALEAKVSIWIIVS